MPGYLMKQPRWKIIGSYKSSQEQMFAPWREGCPRPRGPVEGSGHGSAALPGAAKMYLGSGRSTARGRPGRGGVEALREGPPRGPNQGGPGGPEPRRGRWRSEGTRAAPAPRASSLRGDAALRGPARGAGREEKCPSAQSS